MQHREYKNLVFTSCGDRDLFWNLWLDEDRNYDLVIYHYGDDNSLYEKYNQIAVFSKRNKASKFQNLFQFYQQHNDILSKYDYVFVVDDDIQICTKDINRLFKIAKERELKICQPSLSPKGIIDHYINRHNKKLKIAYTNFVEVNTPLFEKNALFNLLKIYEFDLIGYGIDYLFIQANGLENKNDYAVIHEIIATNPKFKERYSELDLCSTHKKLSSAEKAWERKMLWEEYCKKNGYKSEYKKIVHKYEMI